MIETDCQQNGNDSNTSPFNVLLTLKPTPQITSGTTSIEVKPTPQITSGTTSIEVRLSTTEKPSRTSTSIEVRLSTTEKPSKTSKLLKPKPQPTTNFSTALSTALSTTQGSSSKRYEIY